MRSNQIAFTELLSKIVDNRGRSCPTASVGLPLIATNCVRNELLYPAFEKVRYVSPEIYNSWFRAHPEPGDLIFVCKGSPGQVCMTPDPVSFCIAQDMVAVRADPKKIYPKYLFAVLRSPAVQAQIANMHVGTLIPHFKKGDFDKLVLPVPDISHQKFIGDTYFELSAKIELNRRMNATLEAMTRALYQSWFVDFDPVRTKLEGRQPVGLDEATSKLFPSSFQKSAVGPVPHGWETGPLSDLVEVVKGRSYRSEELADSKTALVTLKSFLRGGGYRPDGLKPFTGEYKPNQRVRPGDLVVALTDVTQAADVIGKPALVQGDDHYETLVASLDVGIVRAKTNRVSAPFLYSLFLTTEFQAHAYSHATGTTVLHLGPAAIPSFVSAIPPVAIADKFAMLAEPIFRSIDENAKQSRNLAAIRDAILPKLLSGELNVLDLESTEELLDA